MELINLAGAAVAGPADPEAGLVAVAVVLLPRRRKRPRPSRFCPGGQERPETPTSAGRGHRRMCVMPFWKKRGPLGHRPGKQRRPTALPEDGLADPDTGLLRTSGAGTSLQRQKPGRMPTRSPFPCPWCGKRWSPGMSRAPGASTWEKAADPVSSGFSDDNQDFLDEGNPLICSYKTVWICRDCQRPGVERAGAPVPLGHGAPGECGKDT